MNSQPPDRGWTPTMLMSGDPFLAVCAGNDAASRRYSAIRPAPGPAGRAGNTAVGSLFGASSIAYVPGGRGPGGRLTPFGRLTVCRLTVEKLPIEVHV